MDTEKTKKCSNPKCRKVLPATVEWFGKRTASLDGLTGLCRKCLQNYSKNYRKDESKQSGKEKEPKKNPNRPTRKEPLTTASPEAIIAALRKGVAREIIQIIEKNF